MRGRVVWLGLILGISCFTLVLNISNISVLISMVRHNLDAAIRECNTVGTAGGISVTGLRVGKVSIGVVILDSILVSILGRDISISWLVVGRSRLVVGWGRLVCWGWSWLVCWGRSRLIGRGWRGR